MSRPRLLLHAGLHKTGTSAIQAFAAAHRGALRARGLWYPGLDPVGPADNLSHNRVAHSLARTGKQGNYSDAQLEALFAHWRERAGGDRLLVSAEALCRHLDPDDGADWPARRRGYLRRVAQALSGFEIAVVLVLRRQDRFAHSAFLENIMKGSRRGAWSFAAFRDYLAERHLRYEDNLDAFARTFGDIRVLVYEDLQRSPAFCARFFAAAGIDAADLAEPGRVRSSLGVRQARIKRALLPCIAGRGMNARVNALLRAPAVERMAARLVADGGCGLWESEAVRREWQRGYDAENERIRRRYLPERSALFAADA